jgi:hypothetical protein
MKLTQGHLVGFLLAVCLGYFLSSCTAPDARTQLARLEQRMSALQTEGTNAALEAERFEAAGDAPAAAEARDRQMAAKAQGDILGAARDVLVGMQEDDGRIEVEGVGRVLAAFVPEPWRSLTLTGITAFALYRQQRVLAASSRIIKGFDALKLKEPSVADAMKRNKSLLDEWQGTTGRAMVNRVRNA